MNTQNACGFVGVGIAMWLLPLLAPTLIEPTGIFSESTRALWLLVMGCVNTTVGGSWLVRSSWVRLQPRVLAWSQVALPSATGEHASSETAPSSEPARLAA